MQHISCQYCGKLFKPHSSVYKYCSIPCSGKHKAQEKIDYFIKFGVFPNNTAAETMRKVVLQLDGIKCSICGISKWLDQDVPVVLDHINGNSSDNTRDNLRIICRNCDALLPTFGSRNRGNGRYARRVRYAQGKSS